MADQKSKWKSQIDGKTKQDRGGKKNVSIAVVRETKPFVKRLASEIGVSQSQVYEFGAYLIAQGLVNKTLDLKPYLRPSGSPRFKSEFDLSAFDEARDAIVSGKGFDL